MGSRIKPQVIDTPTVDHLSEYVRGYPVHIALTVALLPTADPAFSRLPGLNLHSALDVKIVFTRVDDGESFPFGADFQGSLRAAAGDEANDMPVSYIDLEPGEPRRLLFDASSIAPSALEELSAGEYTVNVTYHGASAQPFNVRFRDPTAAEKLELVHIDKEAMEFYNPGRWWPAWTNTGKSGSQPPKISKTDPLRYLRVLRFLYTSVTPPASVNPHVLDGLDGFYAPEVELLRTDLARCRHDVAEAQRHSDKIRTTFPSMVTELRRLEELGSGISFGRDLDDKGGVTKRSSTR
jgi:hypothetical protein